jgi:hypothetical protein
MQFVKWILHFKKMIIHIFFLTLKNQNKMEMYKETKMREIVYERIEIRLEMNISIN